MGVTHCNIKRIMQDSGRYHKIRGNVGFSIHSIDALRGALG
jgi:hypothetical protein